MFLVGGAIHSLQGHLVAHTGVFSLDTITIDTCAMEPARAAACHRLQLLEVCDDGGIRLVRLLLHRLKESLPVLVLIL